MVCSSATQNGTWCGAPELPSAAATTTAAVLLQAMPRKSCRDCFTAVVLPLLLVNVLNWDQECCFGALVCDLLQLLQFDWVGWSLLSCCGGDGLC